VPDLTFPSFSGGEAAPAYHGRTDQEAYYVSAQTLENYIATQTGPAQGRGGTTHVAKVKNSDDRVLLVPFQFNEDQAYIVEFGDRYARIYRNRALQYEAPLTITGATQADPIVVTVAHNLTRGRVVRISDVGGMTQLNDQHFQVEHVLGASVNIDDIANSNPCRVTLANGHGFVGGENVFVEAVGGMTELNDRTFRLVSATGAILSITDITQANPGKVTVSGPHGLSTGAFVLIENVSGMTEVNDERFEITEDADPTKFTIGVNTTGFGTYVAPGAFKTVLLTTTGAGQSWVVPDDFDPGNNIIECIGAGGAGEAAAGEDGDGGGGGGAYSRITNLNLAPGETISYRVGTAGTGNTNGGDTWISTTGVEPTSTLQGALAKGGTTATTQTGGAGGSSSSGIGQIRRSGGTGGNGTNSGGSGGGGGAAGPNGNGGNGGTNSAGADGGAGGGGANGGSNGTGATSDTGGAGGNNRTGSGGGAAGANGTNGGGGGGKTQGSGAAGTGSADILWTATVGGATAGPSGGSGGGDIDAASSNAVNYGGGGGGGRTTPGNGGQGLIAIRYQPFPASQGGTATEVLEDDFDLEGENSLGYAPYTSGGTVKPVGTTSLKLKDLDGEDIDSTAYGAYTSGGTIEAIHEIVTPYTAADLFDADGVPMLQWWQSADFLFLAHPNFHPRSLTRHGHADFRLSEFDAQEGPFLDPNLDEDITIYATGVVTVGTTVTLNSSSPLWSAEHVGAYWMLRIRDDANSPKWTQGTAYSLNDEVVNGGLYYRCTDAGTSGTEPPVHDVGNAWDGGDTSAVCRWLYIHNGRGIVRITGWTSASQVSAVVITELPDGLMSSAGASSRWAEGAWSEAQGFPRSVSIHEGRLAWGGTEQEPLALDFSDATSLFFYNPVEPDGTVTRSTAFRRVLDSDNPIRWLRSTEKGLIIGTLAGEWSVSTEGVTQGFGPDTAVARQFSANGSAPIMPVRNGDSLLYPHRARKRMRDITFSIDQQKLVTSDRNLRSDHIAIEGICWTAYAEEPHRVTWCMLGDGTLAGLTYNREPGAQVSAWHSHVIGGEFDGGDAVVESIAVIPGPDAGVDDLWMAVKRTIDGETVRHVEWMRKPLDYGEDIESGVYMDAAVTYEGAAVTNIPAGTAMHLVGETVDVLADGIYTTKVIDATGVFTVALSTAAELIHVGLYATRTLESMFLEGGPQGEVNTKPLKKRVNKVEIEVVESAKGWVGTDADFMDQMTFDEFWTEDVPRRVSGTIEETINDTAEKRKFVRFEQREPYPTMIASVTARFEVGTDG
jgi:hypothetical protein